MGNVKMGDFKLKINVARFTLEEGEIRSTTRKGNPKVEQIHKETTNFDRGGYVSSNRATGSVSFKEATLCKSVKIDYSEVAFSELYGKAIVVRLVNFEAMKNIHNIMKELGVADCRVQYLGGLSILITIYDLHLTENVRALAQTRLDYFDKVHMWEGQSMYFERIAWLRIQGVPLNILNNKVLDTIGGMFGKVLHKADISISDKDLSFEYVGVLVGDGRCINVDAIVNWQDKKFHVWVMEEVGEWRPDFLEEKVNPSQDVGVESLRL
ncbi:hypothetical protein HanPI659440_Chr16g0628971 [Helianthus annuus]|nr:hypothetical protein HanPI659440_Chr16g0628971 [Helianthus annuus]